MNFYKNSIAIEIVAIFCILFIVNVSAEITCRDPNGKSVDWYYAYKLPHGTEFVYMTSNSKPKEWVWSDENVDNKSSMIGRTVVQGFQNKEDPQLLVLGYNDEPPEGRTDFSCGHTKGLVVADDNTGFWLIHSVPKFAYIYENASDYKYPPTGHLYGQSFLCISIKSKELDKIGLQLMYNEPHIYTSIVPDKFAMQFPHIVIAVKKVRIEKPPYWHAADIISIGGTKFTSFAKSRKFNGDIYSDLLAPTLKTTLYVEGWLHGTGVLPTNCSRNYNVYNIAKVSLGKYEYTFSTYQDHSKWTVGGPSNGWICVGDINRALHQEKRGGGQVCQNSNSIANAYRSSIKSFESCQRKDYYSASRIYSSSSRYSNSIFHK